MIGPLVAQQLATGPQRLSSHAPGLAMRAGKDGRVDLVPVRGVMMSGPESDAPPRCLSDVRWEFVTLAAVSAAGVLWVISSLAG